MSRKINLGILGCGVISHAHAQAALNNPEEVNLVACCDIIPERAVAFGEKYGGLATYTSLDEMLEHPGLDLISVCTPSGMHGDAVLAAAGKGVHSLVEKPMDITHAKLDALVKVSEEGRVKVGCIFQRRAWDIVNRIRGAVQGGEIGKPFMATASMKWYRSQEYYDSGEWRGTYALDGGGALMNQGIHGVDLLYYVMGPVKSVKAHQATLTHTIEVEDSLTATLQFANGALGSLVVTTSCVPGYNMRHDFHGSKGSISLEEDKLLEWSVEGQDAQSTEAEAAERKAVSDPSNISNDGHTRLMKDMAQAITEDRAPQVTPDEGRRAVDLILAMYESARTGREVSLC